MTKRSIAKAVWFVLLGCGGDDESSAEAACDHLRDCLDGCGMSLGQCTGSNTPECHRCITDTSCEDHCAFFGDPVGTTWACQDECAEDGGEAEAEAEAEAEGGDSCEQCLEVCRDQGLPEDTCQAACMDACA